MGWGVGGKLLRICFLPFKGNIHGHQGRKGVSAFLHLPTIVDIWSDVFKREFGEDGLQSWSHVAVLREWGLIHTSIRSSSFPGGHLIFSDELEQTAIGFSVGCSNLAWKSGFSWGKRWGKGKIAQSSAMKAWNKWKAIQICASRRGTIRNVYKSFPH